MTIASKLFFMIGDHPRFAPLKVDLDVSSRRQATNQHVSFGGRLKRSNGSMERNRTPAPAPVTSLVAFSRNDVP
jgi:hypothetical protein